MTSKKVLRIVKTMTSHLFYLHGLYDGLPMRYQDEISGFKLTEDLTSFINFLLFYYPKLTQWLIELKARKEPLTKTKLYHYRNYK